MPLSPLSPVAEVARLDAAAEAASLAVGVAFAAGLTGTPEHARLVAVADVAWRALADAVAALDQPALAARLRFQLAVARAILASEAA